MRLTTDIVRLIILSILMMLSNPLFADTSKILERSQKNPPEWLYDDTSGYILAEVEAPNLTEAKDLAIRELARRIAMSVAANVTHSEKSSASVNSDEGNVKESESFSYSTDVAAARIPYIQGISLSEADGIYWEKRQDKQTGKIYYAYTVRYPLPETELFRMRQEFRTQDSEKRERLSSLKSGINSVTKASQIEQAISELEELKAYFFDEVRNKEASGLQDNYRNLYKSLTLDCSSPSDGTFTVKLLLNGEPFEMTGTPTLKSNCASRLEAKPDGQGFRVTYDAIDCLPDEENWIEVSLRMRDTRFTKKVYL